jgi:ADP-ribose pyrophosphatase
VEKSKEQELLEKSPLMSRKEVFRSKNLILERATLLKKDGSCKSWDIVQRPDAVVVVAVTSKKEILFVKQWRRAIGKRILELPAGLIEKNESPSAAAQRELQEETGYQAGQLISLGGYFSSPGFCSEYLHLFVALDLTHHPLEADEDEAIDLIFLPLLKVEEMIESGEICDAKTIAGIQRYDRWSQF